MSSVFKTNILLETKSFYVKNKFCNFKTNKYFFKTYERFTRMSFYYEAFVF